MFKKAFSLIELLIVVLIVGIVYTLAISGFENLKDKKAQKPTLLNLKSYFIKLKYKDEVKLLCLDECETCLVFVDNELNQELSDNFDGFLDESVKTYAFNVNTGLQLVSESIYFNSENVSENVCFSFSVDKKGVSEQVIVEYKDSVYDFTTHLNPIKKYASTSEFIEERQTVMSEVLN